MILNRAAVMPQILVGTKAFLARGPVLHLYLAKLDGTSHGPTSSGGTAKFLEKASNESFTVQFQTKITSASDFFVLNS